MSIVPPWLPCVVLANRCAGVVFAGGVYKTWVRYDWYHAARLSDFRAVEDITVSQHRSAVVHNLWTCSVISTFLLIVVASFASHLLHAL